MAVILTCAWCAMWEAPASAGSSRYGKCRLNPPQVVVRFHEAEQRDAVVALWPMTQPDDWCGSWKPVYRGSTKSEGSR